MPDNFNQDELAAIPSVLSQPRFATYLAVANNNPLNAMRLYHWNAQISSAFLFPLHIFEICIRNAAADAIESYYNPQWPWSHAFEMSLPAYPRPVFSPRHEIRSARQRHATTGKVIADIKFAFWVSMFTRRHDGRLWRPYLKREFPNIPANMASTQGRLRIHDAAEQVRVLRNRIAHHEPIFQRTLEDDYSAIMEIVSFRCNYTAAWMNRSQSVSTILAMRP